jgi:hypothetical protein
MNTTPTTDTKPTTFNANGFVTANPVKGRVYLTQNNYVTDILCAGCGGEHDTAGWPFWFFYEGNAGLPVCRKCAAIPRQSSNTNSGRPGSSS